MPSAVYTTTSSRTPSAASAMHRSASSASASSHGSHIPINHRRGASARVGGDTRAAPSPVSLFLRNVRLLDLDRLPDWPVVTPTTLGSTDARSRLRGVEWCLYQLFRLYDPAVTTDKLQPFFPPLEPLQSINLRAALYRCFDKLKKDGVLGREIVLRKSMLDECQGDKFWELCLGFSTVVVRKIAIDHHNGTYRPVAERIGAATAITKPQHDSMLPLAIAHRAALTRILSQKETRRQSYAGVLSTFARKEDDLRERKELVQQRIRSDSVQACSENIQVAQDVVETHWLGSQDMQTALLDGSTATATGDDDSWLTRDFDSTWQRDAPEQLFTPPPEEQPTGGILKDLTQRAQEQRQLLRKWQGFYDKFANSKVFSRQDSNAPYPPTDDSEAISLDRHQNLSVHDIPRSPDSPRDRDRPPEPISSHPSITKYDQILSLMREQLRQKFAAGHASPTETIPEVTKRLSYRKPSLTHDPSSSPSHSANGPPASSTGHLHHRSHSQTAVPMRPGIGRRMSSRSRSYHQPKVISQREPIPLKSEIFSPLKRSTTATSQTTSPLNSGRTSSLDDRAAHSYSDLSYPLGPAAANTIVSNNNNTVQVPWAHSPSSSSPEHSSPNSPLQQPQQQQQHQHPSQVFPSTAQHDSGIELSFPPSTNFSASSTTPKAAYDPSPIRPVSLSERTRLSMAPPTVPYPQNQNPISFSNPPSPPLPASSPQTHPNDPSLTERTRLSLSANPSLHRSRTSAFPTLPSMQQPSRQRPASLILNQAPGPKSMHARSNTLNHPHRDITPQEDLFKENAEYASVFRARPRIALSPVLSPMDADFGGRVGDEEGQE